MPSIEEIPGIAADDMRLWFHIELEHFESPRPADIGRFHMALVLTPMKLFVPLYGSTG